MRRSAYFILMALLAAPAGASTGRPETLLSDGNLIDWLYPEMPIDDDGWRGLLPVILLDTEAVAEKPASESAGNARQ